MRKLALFLSVVLVIYAGIEIELPFYETQPGGAHPVEPLLELSAEEGDLNGELRLLTVIQHTTNVFESLWVWVHPDRDLQAAQERTPPGVELEALRELQRQQFQNSFQTAVGVAAEAAGYEIDVRTLAVVAQILAGGPASGVLEPGDIITAVDGVEVTTGAGLVEGLSVHGAGDTVVLELLRDDAPRTVDITLRELDELDGRAGVGIVIETITEAIELPFDATLNETNIIGASAGMMVALTAADLLLAEDLTRGRIIAGTGTIDGSGQVGRIGGIPQKVEAAVEAGAELLLVPANQAEQALEAADGRLEVVGVATFDDVLAALRA